ncbi:ARM repeat-containing protein [Hypoxylon sp. FL1284]|nr:ARM repeat-containing protein [Hypoxylon sp. FL1284]
MTPDEIEELLINAPDEEESRIRILQDIRTTAEGLQAVDSPELGALTEKVGNGSRQGPWRIPLGRSGLLDFFLTLAIKHSQDVQIATHSLRVIGNTCADQDENRQRVVDSSCLPQLVEMLANDTLARVVVPVLFNVCVDYEPAQESAYKAGLVTYLVDILRRPPLRDEVSPYIAIVYKLLGLVAAQEYKPDLVPLITPFCLLTEARDRLSSSSDSPEDVEAFIGLSSASLTYLARQELQQSFLETTGAVSLFLEAFQMATEESLLLQIDDAEDQEQLKQLQLAFTEALADISANPRFVDMCQLDGHQATLLLRWISSPDHRPTLRTAACLALGNIARSDASSIALVQDMSVHKALIAILSSDPSASDAQLLHSTLSFLKNLSIPPSNKEVLSHAGLLDRHVLPRVWGLDTQPQIQFDAVSLTRLLLISCPTTLRHVCAGPPKADSSVSSPPDETLLHQLMDLHRKADQEPIKMEIARAAANVCRVLHSDKPVGSSLLPESAPSLSPPDGEARSLLQNFYSTHHALGETLVYLGLQTKFPVLRSELWFVLALMARSAEGAAVVIQIINEHPRIVNVLVEAVTGEQTPVEDMESQDVAGSNQSTGLDDVSALGALGQLEPQQVEQAKTATVAKVDRENCLVLIAELSKQYSDSISPLAKSTFSRLLKTGGELVLGARNEEAHGELSTRQLQTR